MNRGLIWTLAAFAWTFAPMYAVERLADFYYLLGSPTFYVYSGWRQEVFIIAALGGGVAAARAVKDYRRAVAAELLAVGTFFATAYVLCDPKVCFSLGPDGLEPLRFGMFIGAVTVSGVALGGAPWGRRSSRWEAALSGAAGVYALGFYPVAFTFAGARLIPPLSPWAAGAALFLAAMGTSVAARASLEARLSVALPLAALLALVLTNFGISLAYVGQTEADIAVLVGGATLGAAASVVWRRERGWKPSSALLGAGSVTLVLLMTVVFIPDAVTGVTPSPLTSTPDIGVPAYVGAYQIAAQGHAEGAAVTVSFTGTNATVIQPDNYLSGGLGIHAAGCCTDGIDYAYRFDAVLFHGGNGALVASSWEACDDNAACGGHSWKVLLYSKESPLDLAGNVTLAVEWNGSAVHWVYSVGSGPAANFTSYVPPSAENRDFNTGVSGGVSFSEQKAAYFFQFGIMSRYPIGHGGWTVTLRCPSLLEGGGWRCVDHAGTLRGSDSYWKVIWRWGEDYPGASVTGAGDYTVSFGYSAGAGTKSYESLW